jgi:hypothetical protein
MASIAEYRGAIVEASGHDSLDNRTWNDLNLDAVFAVLDRTESTVGQQLLYARMRFSPVAPNRDAFEALAMRMTSDVAVRERAQMALARLQDPGGYDLHSLARPDALETARWHVVFPVLAILSVGAVALTMLYPGLLLILPAIAVVNLVVRAASSNRVRSVLGSFRQVGPLVAAAAILATIDDPASASITAPLREDGPQLRRLSRCARWVSRDRTSAAAGNLAATIIEYLNLLFLLDVNALYFGARELGSCRVALVRVIAAVGQVDAAISLASFRIGTPGWSRPVFQTPGSPAVFTDMRHPLVNHAVPNSIELAPPHGVLVTGSNMSGKTTFLRTLGVSVVLAQTLNTCLARRYEAPLLHVRSCIGRADDLVSGKSYYMVEVEAVLALVSASTRAEPHLFLFDELFRGTNASERIAAGEAVLLELVEPRTHIIVTATHDGELIDLLRDSYVPYHFTDTIGPQGLVFEYRLRPGPATTRNAIALLKQQGAPDRVVSRALARAAAVDRQRGTGPVES